MEIWISDRKVKWLIYTVLVGLIPALLRLMVWLVSQNRDGELFSAVDFIVFGLIMHISNINEVEHFTDAEKSWRTIHNGVSITFISFYSGLFAAHLFDEAHPWLVDDSAMIILAAALGIVTFALSYTVYHKMSKLDGAVKC